MAALEPRDQADPAAWLSAARTSVGLLLTKLGELAAGGANQVLEPLGLRPRQVYVLATLAADDSLSQQDVSRRLGIDPNVLVGLLDELERQGYAERRRNPRDRRRHLVIVTAEGQRVLREAIALLDAAERELCAAMTPEELTVVRTVAQRLVAEHGHLIRE